MVGTPIGRTAIAYCFWRELSISDLNEVFESSPAHAPGVVCDRYSRVAPTEPQRAREECWRGYSKTARVTRFSKVPGSVSAFRFHIMRCQPPCSRRPEAASSGASHGWLFTPNNHSDAISPSKMTVAYLCVGATRCGPVGRQDWRLRPRGLVAGRLLDSALPHRRRSNLCANIRRSIILDARTQLDKLQTLLCLRK